MDVRWIGTADVAFSTIAGLPCRMHVFIDGAYQRLAMPGPDGKQEGLGLGELVGFKSIYAVEVYPSYVFLPPEFTRMGPGGGDQQRSTPRIPGNVRMPMPKQGENSDAACGAIVI